MWRTMSDADGMPALIEHPAPRSTEQRLGVAPCRLIPSAMSSIVRSAGAGIAGVPFAMVSDYIHSSDQKRCYRRRDGAGVLQPYGGASSRAKICGIIKKRRATLRGHS